MKYTFESFEYIKMTATQRTMQLTKKKNDLKIREYIKVIKICL